MAVESKRVCPICLDDFRDPKLLHCAHTFCRACLAGCTDKKEANVGITCPICRITTLLGRDGIDGLINNYFVLDTTSRKRHICQSCGSEVKVRICMTCEDVLCLNCRTMHACVWIVDRSNNTDADVTSHLPSLDAIPDKYKTVFRAASLSEFFIEFEDSVTQATSISTIIPINENEAWLAVSNGPDIFRYDMLGNMKERLHVAEGIVDGAISPDGILFVLCLSLKCVAFLKDHKWYRFVSFRKKVNPKKMSFLSDGKMVIIYQWDDDDEENDDSSEESTDEGESKSSETCVNCAGKEDSRKTSERRRKSGAIEVIDNDRNVTGRFNKDCDFRPCDVASCPSMDSICICDAYNGTVDIILSDGTLLGRFRREISIPTLDFLGLLSFRHQHPPFKPEGCTSDSYGNFYIVDRESKLIHVLSPTANLLGVVAVDDVADIGAPLSIALDKGGKLWIGSDEYGVVRVFFITQYINDFKLPLLGF